MVSLVCQMYSTNFTIDFVICLKSTQFLPVSLICLSVIIISGMEIPILSVNNWVAFFAYSRNQFVVPHGI